MKITIIAEKYIHDLLTQVVQFFYDTIITALLNSQRMHVLLFT